jgi:hypothetical protein
LKLACGNLKTHQPLDFKELIFCNNPQPAGNESPAASQTDFALIEARAKTKIRFGTSRITAYPKNHTNHSSKRNSRKRFRFRLFKQKCPPVQLPLTVVQIPVFLMTPHHVEHAYGSENFLGGEILRLALSAVKISSV